MRLLLAPAILLALDLRCRGVRLAQERLDWAAPKCETRCALKGHGKQSEMCPYARFFEGKYWLWRGPRMCGSDELRVKVDCEGMDRTEGRHFAELVKEQIGGKHIVMIGDSTMKQTFIGLLCMLWEEELIGDLNPGKPNPAENNEHLHHVEWKGMINGSFPELGEGTKLTFVRMDWGTPGMFLYNILDTADITVANLGMHYHRAIGKDSHVTVDDGVTHVSEFTDDVEVLMRAIKFHGRPGHRAFWRETLACVKYEDNARPNESYGCGTERNVAQTIYNEAIKWKLGYGGLELLRTQDILHNFWWAHPGQHDCCHLVTGVPGLLSATARMLVTQLAAGSANLSNASLQLRRTHRRTGNETDKTCPRLSKSGEDLLTKLCPGNFKLFQAEDQDLRNPVV